MITSTIFEKKHFHENRFEGKMSYTFHQTASIIARSYKEMANITMNHNDSHSDRFIIMAIY